MKRYPYFITDALLLVFTIIAFPLVFIYGSVTNYALALVLVTLIVIRFKLEEDKVRDFNYGIKNLKEINSWESDFFSIGTLKFDYKGEKIWYSSQIGHRFNGSISVDYSIIMKNGIRISFDLDHKKEELSFSGDKKFFILVKKDISAFSKKYGLKRLQNSDGVLKIITRLEFEADTPFSKEKKLAEMSDFLKDYLEFGFALNSKLKKLHNKNSK